MRVIVRVAMNIHCLRSALLLAAASLAGCATSSDRYPSLAVREAERMTGTFTPVEPPAPFAVAPETVRRVEDLVAAASTLHQNFTTKVPAARGLASRASGNGAESDLRSRALLALAELASLRNQTATTLADLDRLEAEAATALGATGPISESQAAVAMMLGEQQEALDSLGTILRDR